MGYIIWGSLGIMEQKIELLYIIMGYILGLQIIVPLKQIEYGVYFWGYVGIMEKKMELLHIYIYIYYNRVYIGFIDYSPP